MPRTNGFTHDDRLPLGTSGLEVSQLCVGTHQLGGSWGPGLDSTAVRYALDHGINFIDTAESYGWGTAIQGLAGALGASLATHRDDYVICCKVGLRRDPAAPLGRVRDASARSLTAALDRSLVALGTDYVDILMLHYPDESLPIDEPLEAFASSIASGKSRFIGLSNHSLEQMDAIASEIEVVAAQFPLSLLSREPGAALAEGCRARGITGMAWGPLAQGFLTREPPVQDRLAEGDYRGGASWFGDGGWRARTAASERLNELARQHDVTAAQLALAWIRWSAPGTVPVFGALDPSQVAENIGSLDIALTEELGFAVEAATAGAPPLDLWEAVPQLPPNS